MGFKLSGWKFAVSDLRPTWNPNYLQLYDGFYLSFELYVIGAPGIVYRQHCLPSFVQQLLAYMALQGQVKVQAMVGVGVMHRCSALFT